MGLLYEVLSYNKVFVEEKQYKQYQSGKYPDKKLVILSCMDTRLVESTPLICAESISKYPFSSISIIV